MDSSNMIFQLHPIITPLLLDQLACSLPKTNTTFLADFHQDRLSVNILQKNNFFPVSQKNCEKVFKS